MAMVVMAVVVIIAVIWCGVIIIGVSKALWDIGWSEIIKT
jgi:hypothetical protein